MAGSYVINLFVGQSFCLKEQKNKMIEQWEHVLSVQVVIQIEMSSR